MGEKKIYFDGEDESIQKSVETKLELVKPLSDQNNIEPLLKKHYKVQKRLERALESDDVKSGLLTNTELKTLNLSPEDQIAYREVRELLKESTQQADEKRVNELFKKEHEKFTKINQEGELIKAEQEFNHDWENRLLPEYQKFIEASGEPISIAHWLDILKREQRGNIGESDSTLKLGTKRFRILGQTSEVDHQVPLYSFLRNRIKGREVNKKIEYGDGTRTYYVTDDELKQIFFEELYFTFDLTPTNNPKLPIIFNPDQKSIQDAWLTIEKLNDKLIDDVIAKKAKS